MTAALSLSLPETCRIIQPARVGMFVERQFGALDPEQLHGILVEVQRGQFERWADLCEWVEEDDRVSSVIATLLESVASLPIDLQPGNGDPALAQLAADETRKMLDQVDNLEENIEEIAHAICSGYSVSEHNWIRRNGVWLSNPIEIRPRDIKPASDWVPMVRTFGAISQADQQATKGERQASSFNWIRTDQHPGKFIVYAYRNRGSTPLRSGLIRRVVWYWLFKRWAFKFWVAAAERFAVPPAIGKIFREANEESRAKLKQGLESLSANQVAILEDNTDIQFPDTKFAQSAEVWQNLIEKCDDAITIATLGSLDNVDAGGDGSRARAESQGDITIAPRIAKIAKAVYGIIERDWTKHFLSYNTHLFGGIMPPIPRFKLGGTPPAKKKDIQVFHLQGGLVTRNEVRSDLGLDALPPEKGGDDLLNAGAPQASGGEPAAAPLAFRQANLYSPNLASEVLGPKSSSATFAGSETMGLANALRLPSEGRASLSATPLGTPLTDSQTQSGTSSPLSKARRPSAKRNKS